MISIREGLKNPNTNKEATYIWKDIVKYEFLKDRIIFPISDNLMGCILGVGTPLNVKFEKNLVSISNTR